MQERPGRGDLYSRAIAYLLAMPTIRSQVGQNQAFRRPCKLPHPLFVSFCASLWPLINIDESVKNLETDDMTNRASPQLRQYQFSLRKLLLWTFVLALALGALAATDPEPGAWVMLSGWFATVLVVRLVFGSRWAAAVSIVPAMLLITSFSCLVWATHGRQPDLRALPLALAAGCYVGALIGLVPFLLIEGTCRLIDWIDGRRHSNE